jgi:hypothetical protein
MLSAALGEYEEAHNLVTFEVVYEDIRELMNECAKCPYELSENGRASLVRNLKDKISVAVTRLIELSAMQPA